MFTSHLSTTLHNDFANMFTSALVNMFTSNLTNIITSDLANRFTSLSINMFTNDLANKFPSDLSNMFTSDLANMFTSALTNMFISDLANKFTSDLANMFTSDLEKCKKLIRSTFSQVKLTDEYVGFVPWIRHLIPKKKIQAFPNCISFQKVFPLHHTIIFTIPFWGKFKTHADI